MRAAEVQPSGSGPAGVPGDARGAGSFPLSVAGAPGRERRTHPALGTLSLPAAGAWHGGCSAKGSSRNEKAVYELVCHMKGFAGEGLCQQDRLQSWGLGSQRCLFFAVVVVRSLLQTRYFG